jgi:hypothetical protein
MYRLRICTQYHKILTQSEPGYLWEKLRFGQSQRTRVIIPPRYQHWDRGKTFFVEGATMWNSLSLEIRSARSTETFKKSYYSHTSTVYVYVSMAS